MTQESTEEKRRYSRVEVPKSMRVVWEGSGKRLVSHVFDLSLDGVFIPTPEPPLVSQTVNLLFVVSGRNIRARAIARRSLTGVGMGVEFVAMGYEERAQLVRFLKELTHWDG